MSASTFFETHDRCYRAAMICILPLAIPMAFWWGLMDLWDAFWTDWTLSKDNAERRRLQAVRARMLADGQ